jgi:sec-independent protein translocase protein TatA
LGFLLKKINFAKNLEMNTLTILALSWQHILIVALILVLLFGGKKIPELMRGVGSGIKEFKDAVKEEDKPGSENKTTNNNNNNNSSSN